jgi:acetyl-CoA acetyltransferase
VAKVAVVGAGQTRFGALPSGGRALFAEAVQAALSSVDKGMAPGEVEEAWIGSVGTGGWQLGNLAALAGEEAALSSIGLHRVENACASSGFAFRDAYLAVKSGAVQVALAGGLEKMTDLSGAHQRYWLGVSGETEWERLAGLTFGGVYGLIASRHFREFGTGREDLARVAVKAHRNASKNPAAHFRKEISIEDAMTAPAVSEPLHLYDCCPVSDGATAAILASEEVARKWTDSPVWVRGSGAATDLLAVHQRESLTSLGATKKAARAAMREAGVSVRDVKVAEVHDCFTIAELIALEDLGFAPAGGAAKMTADGETGIGGRIPVNPSGGLKAKGHPLGATGTGQVCELFKQLRGQADKGREVKGAEVALAHNVGGSGATCAVHVLGI